MVRSSAAVDADSPRQQDWAHPASASATAELDEGEGDEHFRFFPILPSAFTSSLQLQHWHPQLLPTSAGRVLLTRDNAFPHQRVVELSCDGGKVEGVGMTFPAVDQFIGSPLHIINWHIKHVLLRVSFAVDVEDVTGRQRTFCTSNGQSVVHFDLAQLTRQVFDVEYKWALRVRVHANCRVRRIFLSDRLYPDWELPSCLRVRSLQRSTEEQTEPPREERLDKTSPARLQRASAEGPKVRAALVERVAEVMAL